MAILRAPLLDLSRGGGGARVDEVEAQAEQAEHAALTQLHARHGASIFRFLRDLLGDPALAADATQETFVRAFRQLHAFREGASHAPWLYGIARNVSLEIRRARFRAGRVMTSEAEPDRNVAAARTLSPESEVLSREALRIVETAVAQLSDDRRTMLLLRLDHCLAYEEIAELMGFSLAKVKVEIFRARETLREVMATYEAEEGARGRGSR